MFQRTGGLNEDEEELIFETTDDVEVVPTFDEIGLRDDLLRGIYAYGAPCCVTSPHLHDRTQQHTISTTNCTLGQVSRSRQLFSSAQSSLSLGVVT